MRGIGNERKVRCHKEAVEKTLARLGTGYDCTGKLKMVRTRMSPRFLWEGVGADPTGTRAAIPARADSAAEI